MSTSLKSTYQPRKVEPALPDEWTEHKAPTGHTYYYNATTGQSTYTRPTAQAAPAEPQHSVTAPAWGRGSVGNGASLDSATRTVDQARNQFQGSSGRSEHTKHEPTDRPKSKKTIPGAVPWLLVSTKLGRRFVHNPESNESLWRFPTDVLKCVVELDRKERERKARRDRGEPSESEQEDEKASPKIDYDSDEYEEVEVTDDEDGVTASKRPRFEEEQQPPSGPREFNEDDMAYQLAALEDEGGTYPEENGWEDYEEPPLDEADARSLFFDLLDDHRINPYTPWESLIESGRIIEDDRYVCLPTMKSRREAWEAWSMDRMQKLKEEKSKQEKKDPRIPYLAFLQKHATLKLYWPEFKRKYRKEPELRETKFSDKEREKLYREHINRLKLPQSTLKADLTTLLKSLSLKELNSSTSMSMLPPSLLADIRYVSLAESVRDPLVEGYISMQKEAPDATDQSPEAEAELSKQKAERAKREKALEDREQRVNEEKRRRDFALRASKAAAQADLAEVDEAMKVGRRGLMGHYEAKAEEKKQDS